MSKHLMTLIILILLLMGSISLYAMQPFYSFEPSERIIERVDSLTGFDILKYTISLDINDQTRFISGSVLAEVVAEEPLTNIQYRLQGGTLSVSQVKVNNVNTNFVHQNGVITIPLNISTGVSFTTEVIYSGVPGSSPAPYNIGMIFTANSVYTLSNPEAGRYWLPCYDHPWDKALVDWHIRVRSDWLVGANGLRTGITNHGDGTRTHHWSSAHPIATYVMGFGASSYVEFNQSAGTLPIQNFVLPGQLNNAQIDFANVPAMIAYFSSIFGDYPFEKYGHMIVSMATYAAMEHQTMTTFGAAYINGQQTYERIVAHELAHQWYGNLITPVHMGEAWLKECFATYSEALWVHHKDGWQAACNYIRNSIQQYYTNWENQNGPHTIFNPPYNLMFAPPTYQKAASVLHMLRLKMGNEDFFEFIQSLLITYANGNYNTTEFIALAEQISGLDLTQFFQQWIYSSGIPNAEIALFSNGNGLAKVYAKSSSPTTTAFHLDIPLKLNNSAVSDSVVILATPSGHSSYFPIDVAYDLSQVLIDPNNWVLCRTLSRQKVILNSCLPYSSAVRLSWNAFTGLAMIGGYQVFRKTMPNGSYAMISQNLITELSYTDDSVVNGTTYQYYVVAVDSEGFYSEPSNLMQAMPIAFPFDLGFLVVDETRDGSGSAISPTDLMVDSFYANVLGGFAYTSWDVASQGLPSLQELSHYPLVLWHADDFNELLLFDAFDTLGSYVLSGGRLFISGWKYPSLFSDGFRSLFLNDIDLIYNNSAYFVSAESGEYPALMPDPAKLTAVWNGMLPMSYLFGGASDVIYRAQIHSSGVGDNEAVIIKIDSGGSLVLCGVPLYFMQEAGVHGFLQEFLPLFYPPLSTDSPSINIEHLSLSCYPNPFTTKLKIELANPKDGRVSLKLYNLRGQHLHSFADGDLGKGLSSYTLDDQHSLKHLPSGVYIIKASSPKGSISRKILKLQ